MNDVDFSHKPGESSHDRITRIVGQVDQLVKDAQKTPPKPATEASKKLLDMLNQAISMEMQVSIQYMWQHVQWIGIKGYAFNEELKAIAVAEMKHAEAIAERLFYLGENPTTEPAQITVGTTLREMLEADEQAERDTVELYKDIIRTALSENDETTAELFRGLLSDEEAHHDTFISVLEAL